MQAEVPPQDTDEESFIQDSEEENSREGKRDDENEAEANDTEESKSEGGQIPREQKSYDDNSDGEELESKEEESSGEEQSDDESEAGDNCSTEKSGSEEEEISREEERIDDKSDSKGLEMNDNNGDKFDSECERDAQNRSKTEKEEREDEFAKVKCSSQKRSNSDMNCRPTKKIQCEVDINKHEDLLEGGGEESDQEVIVQQPKREERKAVPNFMEPLDLPDNAFGQKTDTDQMRLLVSL